MNHLPAVPGYPGQAPTIPDGIDIVRVTYPDLIGTDRARDILRDQVPRACEDGLAFCRAVFHTSPQGDTIPLVGGLEAGLPDFEVHPDLSTLRPLPWEPGVAWCLADASDPATGSPVPEAPRELLRAVLARVAAQGLTPVIGPELEYYLCEPGPSEGPTWRRSASDIPGAIYTAGLRADPDNHLLRTLRALRDLGLPVTGGNHEYEGGQVEINLAHGSALAAADQVFLFKAAVKELARRDGKLATFMAKPFNDVAGSGFHLHISCEDSEGGNEFSTPGEPHGLAKAARYAIAGLLAHAPALTALLNPTVNSYKRLGPGSLAPWLIDWGLDNRSAMLRIPPDRGKGTRIEVRLGDASANPYLAIAAVTAAVALGIECGEEPPAPLLGYGYDPRRATTLPVHLGVALDALEQDTPLLGYLGKEFVTAFVSYKRNEIERFTRYVTDWEFTEYAYHL